MEQNLVDLGDFLPIDWMDISVLNGDQTFIEGVHPVGNFIITVGSTPKFPHYYVLRFNGRHLSCEDSIEDAKMEASEHVAQILRMSFMKD